MLKTQKPMPFFLVFSSCSFFSIFTCSSMYLSFTPYLISVLKLHLAPKMLFKNPVLCMNTDTKISDVTECPLHKRATSVKLAEIIFFMISLLLAEWYESKAQNLLPVVIHFFQTSEHIQTSEHWDALFNSVELSTLL